MTVLAMPVLDWTTWLDFFLHYCGWSLLAVGGAMTAAPDMHRYLVGQQHWLSDTQFNASFSLAQAAPGPNVLYVALVGWNVGASGGGPWFGLLGMTVALAGMLLPSSTLTYLAAQWGYRNRHLYSVRAFKAGMAPVVVALLVATAWLISSAHDNPNKDWPFWLLTVVGALLSWRTRVHLLWLIAAGALLGALGLV